MQICGTDLGLYLPLQEPGETFEFDFYFLAAKNYFTAKFLSLFNVNLTICIVHEVHAWYIHLVSANNFVVRTAL